MLDVPWPRHLGYLDAVAKPGDHFSIVQPTDGGKTYLAIRGILRPLWSEARVLLIDGKGDDPQLRAVGHKRSRFPRWGPERWGERPHWYRVVVKGELAGVPRIKQREIIYDALCRAWKEGDWVVVIDELKFLVDLHLTNAISDLYERGRTRRITTIGLTQAPRFMPGCVYDQPKHIYLGRIVDTYKRKRLAEIGGYSDAVRVALATLDDHEFLYVGEGGRRLERVMVGR